FLCRLLQRLPFLPSHHRTNPPRPAGRFKNVLKAFLFLRREDKHRSAVESLNAADLCGDETSVDGGAQPDSPEVRGMIFDQRVRAWNGELEMFPIRAAQQPAGADGSLPPGCRGVDWQKACARSNLGCEVESALHQSGQKQTLS